jgi:hypothetical protein
LAVAPSASADRERALEAVIYLATRPFALLFKLVTAIVLLPVRVFRAVRGHRERKRIKSKAAAQPTTTTTT